MWTYSSHGQADKDVVSFSTKHEVVFLLVSGGGGSRERPNCGCRCVLSRTQVAGVDATGQCTSITCFLQAKVVPGSTYAVEDFYIY